MDGSVSNEMFHLEQIANILDYGTNLVVAFFSLVAVYSAAIHYMFDKVSLIFKISAYAILIISGTQLFIFTQRLGVLYRSHVEDLCDIVYRGSIVFSSSRKYCSDYESYLQDIAYIVGFGLYVSVLSIFLYLTFLWRPGRKKKK